jgi:uncharacterized coiled-coil protein SlyX
MPDTIEDIQTTLAFQEKQLSDLSDMVNAQWSEIERLKRKLNDATNKIADLESGSGGSDESNVRPPHW